MSCSDSPPSSSPSNIEVGEYFGPLSWNLSGFERVSSAPAMRKGNGSGSDIYLDYGARGFSINFPCSPLAFKYCHCLVLDLESMSEAVSCF